MQRNLKKSLIKEKGEKGKYRMYCRAAIEKGILKVNLFAVSDIEENVKFPRYRLFISRKERRFITYDRKIKKIGELHFLKASYGMQ